MEAALRLGRSAERRGGSSPSSGTIICGCGVTEAAQSSNLCPFGGADSSSAIRTKFYGDVAQLVLRRTANAVYLKGYCGSESRRLRQVRKVPLNGWQLDLKPRV